METMPFNSVMDTLQSFFQVGDKKTFSRGLMATVIVVTAIAAAALLATTVMTGSIPAMLALGAVIYGGAVGISLLEGKLEDWIRK